ncbi:MAG: hypothetical protein M0006_17060 [Magnetospirillum sp.]|nr:hypothetical protein [Magnetospirillum sp.]
MTERSDLRATLRALMARTVANGCTEAEELTAARLAGRVAALIDGAGHRAPHADAGRSERNSAEYRALLERTVLESLLKAAIHELSLNHINMVSPPRRRAEGQAVEQVGVGALLEPHFAMMLGGRSAMARDIIAQVIEELILEGQLPPHMAIPVGD